MLKKQPDINDDDARCSADPPDPAAGTVPSDEELVRRLLAGDQTAVVALIERYRDHVFSLHEARFRSEEIADDLTQETFLRLFRYLDRPAFVRRGFKSTEAFMNVLSWRVGCGYIGRVTRQRKLHDRYAIVRPDDPPESDVEVLANELSTVVRAAIAALPPALSKVATLYFLEYKTPGQIAVLTGLPPNTVDVYLHRTRNRLKKILGPYWKGKDHV